MNRSTDTDPVERAVDRVAAGFAGRRAERQRRARLDRADFDALRDAGYPLMAVPREYGGCWDGVAGSTRPICRALRSLARGDSSVALVAAMHPAVLSYWLAMPDDRADGEVGVEVEDDPWRRQCAEIYRGVVRGDWWGTVTSEPGTGGDVSRSKMAAEPTERPLEYRLTGPKHFGSGSGVLRYMVTAALPVGETEPDWFFVDLNLDDVHPRGSERAEGDLAAGVTLIAPWDGHGMSATQSHSLNFERFPATRIARTGRLPAIAARSGGFIGCLFTAVVVGIVDVALETARRSRVTEAMSPYQRVEAARAEMEGWLIDQAFEGMVRAVENSGDPRREVLQGKTSVAELAESVLGRLCRSIGGGTYSRSSPFGFWFEDVRALGFLRPPWSLAFDNLIDWLPGSKTTDPQ